MWRHVAAAHTPTVPTQFAHHLSMTHDASTSSGALHSTVPSVTPMPVGTQGAAEARYRSEGSGEGEARSTMTISGEPISSPLQPPTPEDEAGLQSSHSHASLLPPPSPVAHLDTEMIVSDNGSLFENPPAQSSGVGRGYSDRESGGSSGLDAHDRSGCEVQGDTASRQDGGWEVSPVKSVSQTQFSGRSSVSQNRSGAFIFASGAVGHGERYYRR